MVLIDEDLGTVTVPAGQTVTVSKSVSLTEAQKAEIDGLFPNGTYVEGFVSLTAENEPTIGLPVLAFYGDWTAAPIFDRSVWYEEPADGEINVYFPPETATSDLMNRADGVSSPGAPAGTIVGGDWVRPEPVSEGTDPQRGSDRLCGGHPDPRRCHQPCPACHHPHALRRHELTP